MRTRYLFISLSALTFLACDTTSPPKGEVTLEPPAKEAADAPEPDAVGEKTEKAEGKDAPAFINPFERSKRKSITSEALMTTNRMTTGARGYMISEQRVTGPDGNQPWHEGDTVGMPVAVESYVFPGGVNFSFSTHDAIPQGGKKAKTTFDAADKKIAAVLEQGYLKFEPETYFRYTYATGPGIGKDATLKITAETDFDPDSPQAHTMTYEVTVNDDFEAVVGEATVENELQ